MAGDTRSEVTVSRLVAGMQWATKTGGLVSSPGWPSPQDDPHPSDKQRILDEHDVFRAMQRAQRRGATRLMISQATSAASQMKMPVWELIDLLNGLAEPRCTCKSCRVQMS